MAGHSKWSNIKRRKEATDAVRAKIFTKIGREMIVSIKREEQIRIIMLSFVI